MKKKQIVFLSIFLITIGIFFLFERKTEIKEAKNNKNIELAIYINEEETNIIPSIDSGYYYDREKSSCTNGAYINWDSISWSPVVNNMNEYKTRCELHFTTTYTEGILNGTDPVLKDELVPITIDNDGTVRKADLESEWYSYANKEWANAVILEDFDLYDLSGNNYNGKLINGAEIVTDSEGNKAISFDGIDDYVDIVDLPATIDWESGFTIEFEAVWNSLNNYSRILDFGNGPEMSNIIVSNFENTNTLDSSVWDEDREYETYAENYIDLNQKTKTKMVYIKNGESYDLKIYKNAQEVVQDNYIATKLTPNVKRINNYIGKSNWAGDSYFDGLIYSLKISEANGDPILWYDLNNENTLTKNDYERNEVISEEAIESYFVWIPKYRYQLWDLGQYDSLTSIDTSKVHEIPIIFGDYNTSDSIEGECTTPMESGATGNCAVGDYMTHPAFLSISSTGFWVGKFETGYNGATSQSEAEQNVNDSSKIIVKPNVYSWRGIQVANAFYSSYNYQRNLDSHMMKNTEWGAVAYLQHSAYGSSTSVRLNNNSSYITGYAANNEPTCGNTGTNEECNRFCNDGTCNTAYPNSVLASTTGNILGIYDMSGGAWEYPMGVMVDENGNPMSGKNSIYNSGFNGTFGCPTCDNDTSGLTELTGGYSWPDKKYYDAYLYSVSRNQFQRRILGDATGEMGPFNSVTYITRTRYISSWYADEGFFINHELPWFHVGGYCFSGEGAGAFAFNSEPGRINNGITFRVILTLTGGTS